MNNNSEQISRYLQNEMTAEERTAFEKQMGDDKDLRQEVFIQEQIITAAKTAGLKNTFARAIKWKWISKRLTQFGIGLIILVAAAFVFYAIKTNMFSNHEAGGRVNVEGTERIIINNAADTIIETDDGVVFAIPAQAFDSKTGEVQLEIRTAIRPYDIMRQGLSTESNGALLQTAGMFYINGYEDGKPIGLVKNIDVSVPTHKVNPAMKLFDGIMDSSGNINWVNPKPIENKLRTYDITTLDFYPPNYIPALKALGKHYLNKKYTDSLYYSFSGYWHGYPEKARTQTADPIISEAVVSENIPKNDTSIDRAQPVDSTIKPGVASEKNPKNDTSIDRYHYPSDMPYEIDPSRIRAIWDRKFNNTLLATKEFEERLRFIHSLCESDFLRIYIERLDKPMYEIDQLIAERTTGRIREKFLEFAARKDGRVILKQGIQEKLSAYFEKKYKAYKDATEKTRAKYEAELAKLNQVASEKRGEHIIRDMIREEKNFNEEFCINLTEAYNQIGIKRKCDDTIPPPPPNSIEYYNVTVDTVGWKNLDMYVFDATANRESMTYTDPVTGKTASLTYKELSITIKDMDQYDKVMVYLIPDSLSSFQRLRQQGNLFKENLNSLFRYDVVATGYKGDTIFYYKQGNVQPGQYAVGLSLVSENGLKGILQKYSGQKSNELRTEIEYQLFEQQEMMRQVQLGKEYKFREKVAFAIFSCGEGSYGIPEYPERQPGYITK